MRLLITGGSQGARALNRLLPAALSLLPVDQQPEVIHQAGKGWQDETREAYRKGGVQADVKEFIDDMAGAYGWADLVVCRSGALTVSELAASGVASVLVPFPHAVDDHQSRNAEFLVEAGAAEMMPEADCTPGSIATRLGRLLNDRPGLLNMANAARSVAIPDSAEQVASLCREFLPA
jgi:UDP-N-acetylglucosamine--N-acetylmuramyl-(pentapeptide) pyrophosphoryl-undecaprenol N-acetylglucosamine transferase